MLKLLCDCSWWAKSDLFFLTWKFQKMPKGSVAPMLPGNWWDLLEVPSKVSRAHFAPKSWLAMTPVEDSGSAPLKNRPCSYACAAGCYLVVTQIVHLALEVQKHNHKKKAMIRAMFSSSLGSGIEWNISEFAFLDYQNFFWYQSNMSGHLHLENLKIRSLINFRFLRKKKKKKGEMYK